MNLVVCTISAFLIMGKKSPLILEILQAAPLVILTRKNQGNLSNLFISDSIFFMTKV